MAAQNEGIDAGVDERLEVNLGDFARDVGVGPALLREGDEQRGGGLDHGDVGIERMDGVGIRLRPHRPLGGDDADDAGGARDRRARAWLDDADDRVNEQISWTLSWDIDSSLGSGSCVLARQPIPRRERLKQTPWQPRIWP